MVLLRILRKCLRGREIFIPGGRLIMRRFILFDSDYLGLYCHQICGLDHDALHNHPWSWSAGLVLSGWYAEERATISTSLVRRVLRTGSVNVLSHAIFHRINDVSPNSAWTLYIHGRRTQKDGFLVPDGAGWMYRDADEVKLEATRPISQK